MARCVGDRIKMVSTWEEVRLPTTSGDPWPLERWRTVDGRGYLPRQRCQARLPPRGPPCFSSRGAHGPRMTWRRPYCRHVQQMHTTHVATFQVETSRMTLTGRMYWGYWRSIWHWRWSDVSLSWTCSELVWHCPFQTHLHFYQEKCDVNC